MEEKITALAVANFFIEKAKSESIEMTHLKLQKLTYLAHAWHLGVEGKPLFDDDVIAWQYGPVFINIYNAFKSYKKNPIRELGRDIYNDAPKISNKEGRQAKLLDMVWKSHKGLDASTLINITHVIDGPWDRVYHRLGGKNMYNPCIPNDLIRKYYEEVIIKTMKNKPEMEAVHE